MGNQQPKTPRFFIDYLSYVHAVGEEKGTFFKDSFADPTDWYSDGESMHTNDVKGETGKIHSGKTTDLLYCNTSNLLKFMPDNAVDGLNPIFELRKTQGEASKFPQLYINCFVMLNHNLQGMHISPNFYYNNTLRDSMADTNMEKIVNAEDFDKPYSDIADDTETGLNCGFTVVKMTGNQKVNIGSDHVNDAPTQNIANDNLKSINK